MASRQENLFERDLNPYQRMIYSQILQHFADQFIHRATRRKVAKQQLVASDTLDSLKAGSQFLVEFINRQLADVLRAGLAAEDFQRRYRLCSNIDDQRQAILEFAELLGGTAASLASDEAALDRSFDFDAVIERHTRRSAEAEQRIEVACRCLGRLIRRYFQLLDAKEIKRTWQTLDVEHTLYTVLTTRLDDRVHLAAFGCFRTVVSALPLEIARGLLSVETTSVATRTATDSTRPTWNQCEALDLLLYVARPTYRSIVRRRLAQPEPGDDMFVRRRIVRAIASQLPSDTQLRSLISYAADDSSEFVRQALPRIYVKLEADNAVDGLRQLMLHDKEPRVRAAAIVEGSVVIQRDDLQLSFVQLLYEVLQNDDHLFVVRTAMHTLCRWAEIFATRESDSVSKVAADVSNDQTHNDGQLCCDVVPPVEPNLGQLSKIPMRRWSELRSFIQQKIQPQLARLRRECDQIPMRRVAANASEKLWLFCDSDASNLYFRLKTLCGPVLSGTCRRIPKHALRGYDDDFVGRILAVMAQDDFAFEIEKGFFTDTVTRGYLFRFRFWRLWHEMMTPSPDKRQAFSHIHGRASYASLRAPSGILAELSETKVPGEPLFIAEEGGWRPYLPLPDDVLSSLNQLGTHRSVCFYTAEGVTTLTPPRFFVQRAISWIRLTLRFPRIARLRNWTQDGGSDPDAYLSELRKYGIQISFRPYSAASQEECDQKFNTTPDQQEFDESVSRFFPKAAACFVGPLLIGQSYFRDFKVYFTSVYENSIAQLVAFTSAFFVLFFLKHWYANDSLRSARNRICMSIGGWGTRGKSGTERLKAALLNALGYSITSKSSGCEAMFLYAPTYGRLREYILYRPYDKATIWEHRNVIMLASKLKSQMFIWECMGLTPAYVDVLQKQWTRDDLNTITNTFPDHEDLQGPAGINVAETISQFVAKKSTVITTEQQMRPILTQEARIQQSNLVGVGWLESGLLTDDVLNRFPYTEHPDNIALVQRMAIEMGIDPDFAVKQMSDQMIPDLGVLLTSPPASVDSRTLIFTNGCSANERLGCMGNWTRLGFATQDYVKEPAVWVSTVVNNRADRIARSHVFARILVHDVSADRHFLIGNNLKGFLGYIKEAWEEYVNDVAIWKEADSDNQPAIERWQQLARRFRQYTTPAEVANAIKALVAQLVNGADSKAAKFDCTDNWDQPKKVADELIAFDLPPEIVEDFQKYHDFILKGCQEFVALADRINVASPGQVASITTDALQQLWTWYERKLIVVEDYFATGEQVVNTIARQTPPGMTNRIIGLQNIKGTGLDFVYRWQSWQNCYEICSQVLSDDVGVIDAGLQQLSEFQDYGLLSENHVRHAIQHARKSAAARRESTLGQLEMIETNLNRTLEKIKASLNSGPRKSGVTDKLLEWLEEFLDVGDAIRRRKESDAIYRDLAKEQISQERALLELRAINKRQKGGWVSKKLKAMFSKEKQENK